MERLQAFKFELMPTAGQVRKMRQFAGACRFVYNKALALQKENHAAGGKFIGKFAMKKCFTEWRNSAATPWLADAPRHPVDEAILDLDRAFQNFFAKRADFPQFKRKGKSSDSFRYPDPKQIKLDRENGRISLPKLGYIRYRNSRMVLGEVRSATVSHRAGKCYVSILTKREVAQPVPHGPAVGIDVGVARLATMSDGKFIAPLASFKKHEQRLAKYQRRMSRKVKGSSNWKKAKARVQRIHARIADARKDFLHKASNTISKNHAMIAVEDLQVRNMSKSASGTADAPGRNVRAKSGLNKSILDQGWFEFRRQLEYKTAWRGGFFVAVPAANTSRTCPCCGHMSADNRRTQALFACVRCGHEANSDHVGAINVLERGQRLLACGETVQSGRSKKQEPAEAAQAIAAWVQ
ncbi:IS200/IS605 family element transposase accessory protein TnpB [Paraburkholderia panacisoli]|uniref:IS200/IS605 family element transposase accessory protein TnpB n=1 Tax=Paraburkholderia panacisoli TaxID=2603818 RepID=A0A5B0GZI5_9BURK|nr:RNA-guided endonuclease TnpB family protein [Paraburkholderia panacisoli]KAA1008203.1 IS200/IS605 family element transposase accessory protein TnpB [Paraburkholderia panacisoli]